MPEPIPFLSELSIYYYTREDPNICLQLPNICLTSQKTHREDTNIKGWSGVTDDTQRNPHYTCSHRVDVEFDAAAKPNSFLNCFILYFI